MTAVTITRTAAAVFSLSIQRVCIKPSRVPSTVVVVTGMIGVNKTHEALRLASILVGGEKQ